MIIAVIPAKKDSTRLPNKNTIKIFGESLLFRAINYAKGIKKVKRIFVSTDAQDIAKEAKEAGVEVIIRPSELAGETPLIDVYRHALKNINDKRITHIVGIQPDHPDRRINADEAISYLIKNNIDDLFTVDRNGKKNGSLRILTVRAIMQESVLSHTTWLDESTNIHTDDDIIEAKIRLMIPNTVIKVEDKIISEDSPAFIIAEAGCNHMCRIDIAKEMISKAAEMGVDAIKFQTYKAERLSSKNSQAYGNINTKSQYEYYKQFDKFGKDEYTELFKYAKEKNIIAFSTPFDIENAKMLNDIGMPLFKVASCDLPYDDLLKVIASFGKPVILSTGGSELQEVKHAVITLYESGARDIILMACTLSYPTKPKDANYRKILSLKEVFKQFLVGMSDHLEPDENMICGSVYVSLGARLVEKHFTLDRKIEGGGNFFSAEPADIDKMVRNIRLSEVMLGESRFKTYEAEMAARQNARRSLVASVSLKAGTVITKDMIDVKRPGTGISPSQIDKVIGRKLKRELTEEAQIRWDDLE